MRILARPLFHKRHEKWEYFSALWSYKYYNVLRTDIVYKQISTRKCGIFAHYAALNSGEKMGDIFESEEH